MSLRRLFIAPVLAFVVLTGVPRDASADWLFTPFIGWNWGGSADFTDAAGDFEDEFEQKVNFGAQLSWMGAGVVGFEVDFGYSPNFFQSTAGEDDFEWGDSNLTTLMANVKVGAPFGGQSGGGIRPYASGGVGLIRARIDDPDDIFEVDRNDWGFNVGAGVAGFFNDNLGVQGDVRYFRSLQDDDPDGDLDLAMGSFHFWRGSVGLVFRF